MATKAELKAQLKELKLQEKERERRMDAALKSRQAEIKEIEKAAKIEADVAYREILSLQKEQAKVRKALEKAK